MKSLDSSTLELIKKEEEIPIRRWMQTPLAQSLMDRMLSSLEFEELPNRERGIAKALEKTFEWAFISPPKRDRRWNSLIDWLESGQSVYWITGKPGSGKSTLMKFIYSNIRTKRALSKWCREETLVMASFFFWNSGSEMQMSREGLLKSLLWQVLTQRRLLSLEQTPGKWNALALSRDFSRDWKWEDLKRAFTFLL